MTTEELQAYYSNLLIIQFNQKPKAIGTIQALAGAAIASNIEYQVKNDFNLETAVGAQLDIIGDKVGVSRIAPVSLATPDFFSMVDSDAPSIFLNGFASSDLPIVIPAWYWYGAIPITAMWSMDDDTYRKAIKYTIALNGLDYSLFGIWEMVSDHAVSGFNSTTYVEFTEDGAVPMAVRCDIYQNGVTDLLVKYIIATKSLPIPTGVLCTLYVDTVLTAY